MELRDFIRQCQTSRDLRGPWLRAVAELEMKDQKDSPVPLFRLALCKAMASASDKYAEGDRQKLLKTNEISSLGSDAKKKH